MAGELLTEEPRPDPARSRRFATPTALHVVDLPAYVERTRAAQLAHGRVPDPESDRARELALDRGARLREAGVACPEHDSPERGAWLRVVSHPDPREAAAEGHQGSLTAMLGLAQWLRGPKVCVLVRGPRGTGKTVATWWALAGHGGLYLTAGAVQEPPEQWFATRRQALAVRGVLVFNDLTERLREWEWGRAAEVIEARADVGLRTIVTTNRSAAEVEAPECLGPRVWERLRGAVVTAGGASLRGAP